MGIEISNANSIFDGIATKLRAAAVKGMTNACFIVERDSKADCPHDTGLLRESITSSIEEKGNLIEGSIGSNLEYAPYIHQGTGIYAIEGNGRKEVPWHYKDSQGKWHSTKGIKPRPFIFEAMEKDRSRIIDTIEEAMRV